MRIIPYYEYRNSSSKQVKELKALIENIGTKDFYPLFSGMFEKNSKLLSYQMMSDTIFVVRRFVRYRNSFLPTGFVSLLVDDDETLVLVKIRMHGLVVFILLIWFICLISILILFFVKDAPLELTTLVLLMIIISYVIIQAAFWLEVRELADIFDSLF